MDRKVPVWGDKRRGIRHKPDRDTEGVLRAMQMVHTSLSSQMRKSRYTVGKGVV